MSRSPCPCTFLLVFTLICVAADTNPNCPPGWVNDSRLNNNCYKPYTDMMTWIDAEFQCRFDSNRTGHLASIHNVFEQNYLFQLAHDYGLTIKDGWIWIGLQNLNTPNSETYAWIDGTPLDFTNWAPGDPQNVCYEHGICFQVVEFHDGYHDAYKWITGDCKAYGRSFICQISNR